MQSEERSSDLMPWPEPNLAAGPDVCVNWRSFKAVLFDLDGVVTNSARLHELAWKVVFDDILLQHANKTGVKFRPFEIELDYVKYVDGKPREDGIKAFLASRGFEIGRHEVDSATGLPDTKDIAARKNKIFLKHLEQLGIEAYPGALRLIHGLRALGCRLAVISSSRNCSAVLKAARLVDMFDAQVDGNVAERMHLAGKPAPDTFLLAARQLQVAPREAAIIEDSISGVRAACAGHFGFIVGVDRLKIGPQLLAHGADSVVTDLGQLMPSCEQRPSGDISHAIPEIIRDVEARLRNNRVVLFLDYDGTLTPIVERPELAVLDDGTRAIVRRLARYCTVIIISGRALSDVAERVGIDTVIYAGSHGFEIAGPKAHPIRNKVGVEHIPAIRSAARELHQRLDVIDGVIIEDKAFSVAVHYRLVDETRLTEVAHAVQEVLAARPGLCIVKGKKVYELRPNIKWDKGQALLWILQELGLDSPDVVPIFIGDDSTDEDAFKELIERGIGVMVGEARATYARYRLSDPGEVREFLYRLAGALCGAAVE